MKIDSITRKALEGIRKPLETARSVTDGLESVKKERTEKRQRGEEARTELVKLETARRLGTTVDSSMLEALRSSVRDDQSEDQVLEGVEAELRERLGAMHEALLEGIATVERSLGEIRDTRLAELRSELATLGPKVHAVVAKIEALRTVPTGWQWWDLNRPLVPRVRLYEVELVPEQVVPDEAEVRSIRESLAGLDDALAALLRARDLAQECARSGSTTGRLADRKWVTTELNEVVN